MQLNLLSNKTIHSALTNLGPDSVVIDLSQEIANGMPVFFQHIPYNLTLNRRHSDPHAKPRDNDSSFVNEVITTSAHVGTHIDALGHFSANQCVHGGKPAQSIESRDGLTSLDATEISPIFSRAILLDIPKVKGVDVLEPAYEITIDDVKAGLELANTTVQKGDAILFRTGWAKYWALDQDLYAGYLGGMPGPAIPAANWLLEQGANLMGSDTPAFECLPSPYGSVHALLLVDNAVHIIENLNLESAAQNNHLVFVLCATPLPLKGSSASPLRALAITYGK